MQSATITKAIVQRSAGGAVKSKFNDEMRICINVSKQDGTTETIWGGQNSVLRLYRQGDTIEYTKAGNEYVFFNEPKPNIANAQSDNARNATPSVQAVSSVQKWEKPSELVRQNMLHYIEFEAEVYLHTFKSVSEKMSDMGLKDSEIKDITTTIFIQTQRKFNI